MNGWRHSFRATLVRCRSMVLGCSAVTARLCAPKYHLSARAAVLRRARVGRTAESHVPSGVNYLRAHTRTRASCVASGKFIIPRTTLVAKLLLGGGS